MRKRNCEEEESSEEKNIILGKKTMGVSHAIIISTTDLLMNVSKVPYKSTGSFIDRVLSIDRIHRTLTLRIEVTVANTSILK